MKTEQLTELLEKLATKLGTTAEYIFGLYTKQAFIHGIGGFIIALLLVIIMIALLKLTIIPYLKADTFIKKEKQFIYALLGIFTVIYVTAILVLISGATTALFNPEYWAFTQILKQIK